MWGQSTEDEELTEKYENELLNLEMALIYAYRRNPELLDLEVENLVTQVIRFYEAQKSGREVTINLSAKTQPVFEDLQEISNILLHGLIPGVKPKVHYILGFQSETGEFATITVDELLACLKRIRRSIRMWNKKHGRRGYFDVVHQFIPPPEEPQSN